MGWRADRLLALPFTPAMEMETMDLSSLGKAIALLGFALLVVGGALWLLGRTGLPLGRLPGDLRIEGEHVSCYVPIVTMILLSLLLTLVLNIIIRLLNR
jgi:hypothetical protein